jgi:hypothetical protein
VGLGGGGGGGHNSGDSVYAVSNFFLEATMTDYGYKTIYWGGGEANKCVNHRACM